MTPFPVPAFTTNAFYSAVGPLIGLLMSISTLYTVSRLIKLLVEEKEERMKETLKIMGLRAWVHFCGWIVSDFIIFTSIAVLVTLLLTISFVKLSSSILVFLW